jgi:hypothetical protein
VTECEFLAYREGLEEIVLQCRSGSSYFLARSPRSTLQQGRWFPSRSFR